jgi:uroporphyrinogen-III decarboxylase
MLATLHTVLSFVTNPTLELVTAVLAFLSAAVVAYAREQVRAGTNWVLAPLN